MKLAKLSMPRRRVRGSRSLRDRGSDRRAASARRHAERELGREQVVGDPHLVAIGVGAEGQQRRVLRLPAEAADAALAGAAVGDDGGAAADAVAVAIVADPRGAIRVSSSMASTSPAPNSGIGTRRAMTLASAGITGWQRVPGTENRWNSDSPDASSGLELAVRVSAAGAHLRDRLIAADGRHVVARRRSSCR